jgi:hypothetical protein
MTKSGKDKRISGEGIFHYVLSLTWLKRSITGQQQNPTAVRVDKMCVWKGQRSVLQGDNIFKDMSQ